MNSNFTIKDGQTIVFVGDSITEPVDGYVGIVEHMLGAMAPGARLTCLNKGISGNKVNDLLARADQDFIAPNPDWITIAIGINDVWHGENGNPLPEFKRMYVELVDKLQSKTKAKLALFTTTVIGEDLNTEENKKLVGYNEFIRELAKEKGALLVEQNKTFHEAINEWHKAGTDLKFTIDGVHMKPAGDYLMAVTLLKAWGLL